MKTILTNMKIKYKLLLMISILVLLTCISITSIAFSGIQEIYDGKVETTVYNTIEEVSNYVNTELTSIVNLVHYSMVGDNVQTVLNTQTGNTTEEYIRVGSVIIPVLTQLQVQNSFIESAVLYWRGQWFSCDNYQVRYDFSEILEKVKASQLIFWSDKVYVNEETGEKILPMGVRVPSGIRILDENVYLIVNISCEKIANYLLKCEKELQCTLIMRNGDTIIYGDQQIYNKREQSPYIYKDINIHINDWVITCIQNTDDMYLPMQQIRNRIMITVMFIMLIGVALAAAVTKTITVPLKKVSQLTKSVQKSDFNKRTSINRNDEIGELAKEFDNMCEQLSISSRLLEEEKCQTKIKEDLKRKAEIKVLQAQINPHFLYNTLDSLYWYSISGKKDEISEIVLKLSTMLRIGLSKGGEIIPLENEISHAECYLKIQKTIFPDKFNYSIETDDNIKSLNIVKIILQPLAENSIVHGFSDVETGGIIKVKVFQEKEFVMLTVEDNGRGFAAAQAEKGLQNKFSGYALKNIEERLRLHYDSDVTINIESIPYEKTTVTISILTAALNT